jgi:hypothetical protein
VESVGLFVMLGLRRRFRRYMESRDYKRRDLKGISLMIDD